MECIYKYKIILLDMAIYDLEEIYNYISQVLKEPIIAERLINKIVIGINDLILSPYISPKIHVKKQRKPCRRLVVGNYIVLYQINEMQKVIFILHIFYGKRDYLVIED